MKTRPLIGISLDYQVSKTYAQVPWYALRKNYFDALLACGADPIGIVYDNQYLDSILPTLDGVLVPGGYFDFPPQCSGVEKTHTSLVLNEKRSGHDLELIKRVLKLRKPFLGICAGMQGLNLALGGTLYQDISSEIEGSLQHEQDQGAWIPTHTVTLKKGSLLEKIMAKESFVVNSTHHQSVRQLGHGLSVSALAPDGVVEAIEYEDHPFCIGVEWHPEYFTNSYDLNLFKGFVASTKK